MEPKTITNIQASEHEGVVIVTFTTDGQERYVKAHNSSTKPADLLRDVTQHLDYWNRIDPSMLNEYGDWKFW